MLGIGFVCFVCSSWMLPGGHPWVSPFPLLSSPIAWPYKIRMKKLALLLFALMALASSSLAHAANDATLRVCFVVGVKPEAVIEQWLPMFASLTQETGRPIEIVLRESYAEMLESYRRGEIDLLVAGPFTYVKMQRDAGAELIAGAQREGGPLMGAIVVRRDSGIESIEGLEGRSLAFTDTYSTTGYLLPRVALAQHGFSQPADALSEVILSGHHTASRDALLAGRIDAAAMATYFIEELSPEQQGQLRSIFMTSPLPPEPIFARPDLDENLRAEIKTALLSMHEHVPPDVMHRLNVARFVAVTDADYDAIREAAAVLATLPKLAYAIDYVRAPAPLMQALVRARLWGIGAIASVPALALLILLILAIAFAGRISRDVNLRLRVTLVGTMVAVGIVVSGLSIAHLNRRLHSTSLEWLHSIDSFTTQSARAVAEGQAQLIDPFAAGLAAQRGIRSVKVLRNGIYIADSEGGDRGHSIVQKILAGTYPPAARDDERTIRIHEAIDVGGQRWGMVQVGLDRDRLEAIARNVAVGNLIAVAVLIGLGFALALYWSHSLTRRIVRLADAVNAMREGRSPSLAELAGPDQLGQLASAFITMRSELTQKAEMLELKASALDAATERLAHFSEEEERLEETIQGIEEEIGSVATERLEAIRNQLEGIAEVGARDAQGETALRQKIDEIERELPKLGELRRTSILGTAPAFLPVIRDIIIRSRDAEPVLLFGESGSGKTGVARAIHELSQRGEKPFVEYNCAEFAAADPIIVLGKLFGYGANSGIAHVPKEGQPGLLDQCDGATLFLDEIALLPPQAQGMLLLPLEGRPFNPAAGKGAPKSADVRFIFASNVPLEAEVAAGRFRNDLLRRIKARGLIRIPPLRDRLEDVNLLARHFLERICRDKKIALELSDDALTALTHFDYHHFNVAELSSAIKVASDNALFQERAIIQPEHFEDEIAAIMRQGKKLVASERTFDDEERREIEALRQNEFRMGPSEAAMGYAPGAKTLTNHLRGIVFKVLSLVDGNIDAAVAVLAGERSSSAAQARVRRKIEGYIQKVEQSIAEKTTERLFNNLPQKHHEALHAAIARGRPSS